MEIPKATLERFQLQIKDTRTERGELLKEFLEQINMSRLGTNFKQVSIAKIGMDVAHIPTKDLYFLLSVCKDSGARAKRYDTGFSKRFYYELSVQKNATTKTNS